MDELPMHPGLLKPGLDTVSLYKSHTTVDVLRLDEVHPVVSGNKWYKLKEYLADALQKNCSTIITFGGAYSNHIVATAAAAKWCNLKSIGIIKSHQPKQLSPTLQQAINYEMAIHFAPAESDMQHILSNCDDVCYTIPMGGYGWPGKEGAKTILSDVMIGNYTHIICAVGTGTMLAGITESILPAQRAIGISAMKNNFSLEAAVNALLPERKQAPFQILHQYHFGGFAKYTPELIRFMNEWYEHTGIPSDIVYTGKLFFAVNDLIEKNYFPSPAKILVIHSGGLQGNASLPKGTLIF